MPNFADVTSMTIPEGEVIKITSGSTILWEKVTTPTLPDTEYSGTFEAYGEDEVILYAGTRVYEDDYKNLYIIRATPTTDGDIVSRVDNRKVTFGNGNIQTNGIDVGVVAEESAYPDSFRITLGSGYFEGEYYWGFDLR